MRYLPIYFICCDFYRIGTMTVWVQSVCLSVYSKTIMPRNFKLGTHYPLGGWQNAIDFFKLFPNIISKIFEPFKFKLGINYTFGRGQVPIGFHMVILCFKVTEVKNVMGYFPIWSFWTVSAILVSLSITNLVQVIQHKFDLRQTLLIWTAIVNFKVTDIKQSKHFSWPPKSRSHFI